MKSPQNSTVRRAHPRTRGENTTVRGEGEPFAGSPPHTRGKLYHVLVGGHADGLTPAHAGKTILQLLLYLGDEAHPRTRGENPSTSTSRHIVSGSPPHTRGKLLGNRLLGARAGLTPAHAGKTIVGNSIICKRKAHPRTRGENSSRPFGNKSCLGSPPHTRGKPKLHRQLLQGGRLTPAHAGKTRVSK